METNKQKVGTRIKKVRNDLKLNQEQFGLKIGGLKKSAISAYESGDSSPSPETLASIAKLGKVSLDWLIAGIEREQLDRIIHSIESETNDIDLWRAVIETVEEHLQGNDQQLAPAKKAELITTLYEMFAEEEEKQVDKKTVAKLIRLAS